MPVALHNYARVTPERFKFCVETSKSGKDHIKVKDTRTDWNFIVELSDFTIQWEKASGDGTLGFFGITEPRRANYTLTLRDGTPECVAFLRDACERTLAWMEAAGLIDPSSTRRLPFEGDMVKVKRRLCKWAKEGEEPKRDPIPIYVPPGVRSDAILHRGNIVRPTVELMPWIMDDGTHGVSLYVKNVLLVDAKSPANMSIPEMATPEMAVPTGMSIPDLPFKQGPSKRART